MDLPPESRHLDLYLAQLRLTDKNSQGYVLGRERTLDCIAMHCIALGIDREELARDPAILAIVNTNSPLQLDIPMTEAVLELAASGQVTCITPFTLAGAMSPATIAGTLVQQTAEILAVMTLAQIVKPGAPVMYGSFASNVDMRSGAPGGSHRLRKLAHILRWGARATSKQCLEPQRSFVVRVASTLGGAAKLSVRAIGQNMRNTGCPGTRPSRSSSGRTQWCNAASERTLVELIRRMICSGPICSGCVNPAALSSSFSACRVF